MTHHIPPTEKELHTEDQDCECNPIFQLDELSGEMVWIHLPMDNKELLDNFIQI